MPRSAEMSGMGDLQLIDRAVSNASAARYGARKQNENRLRELFSEPVIVVKPQFPKQPPSTGNTLAYTARRPERRGNRPASG